MFVGLAHECLLSPAGQCALDYLRSRRGLAPHTIRRWQLGYNPSAGSLPAEQWGAETKNGWVWLPAGIVIPIEAGGTLWAIKVRQKTGKVPKYFCVEGSRRGLFGTARLASGEPADTVVLVEGEFDAMLLYQEAGDLVGVVTVGSASGAVETKWLWELRHARRILVAYDRDVTGQEGARVLAALSRRVRLVQPIGAKDLTDMHRIGGDLREWVRYHLRKRG